MLSTESRTLTCESNFRYRQDISHAALRPRQLGPVESKLLAGTADDARVKDLTRPAEWNLRLPPFAVNGHDHVAITALILMMVESTPAFGEPFSECCAFHRYAPVFEAYMRARSNLTPRDQVGGDRLRPCFAILAM
jgi:hypothetical protein